MPGDLRPLKNVLGHLGSDDLVVELRGALAVQAEKEILREFRMSVDPWDDAWDPVERFSKKGNRGKPLMDSGQLRGSRVANPTSTGIEAGLSAPYASFQQFGTRQRGSSSRVQKPRVRARASYLGGIRPRAMLPIPKVGRRGGFDSSTWAPAFERVALRILKKRSRG